MSEDTQNVTWLEPRAFSPYSIWLATEAEVFGPGRFKLLTNREENYTPLPFSSKIKRKQSCLCLNTLIKEAQDVQGRLCKGEHCFVSGLESQAHIDPRLPVHCEPGCSSGASLMAFLFQAHPCHSWLRRSWPRHEQVRPGGQVTAARACIGTEARSWWHIHSQGSVLGDFQKYTLYSLKMYSSVCIQNFRNKPKMKVLPK